VIEQIIQMFGLSPVKQVIPVESMKDVIGYYDRLARRRVPTDEFCEAGEASSQAFYFDGRDLPEGCKVTFHNIEVEKTCHL
jgi:hypothetical protein